MNAPAHDWHFAYLLPHVSFRSQIENEYLALVPFSDPRFVRLASSHEAVAALATKVTDQFGRKIKPSALLIHADAPRNVDFYAILSFRNAIAISSLVDGWSFRIGGGKAHYPLWSDFFDFYPFTATRNGHELIANSMALISVDRPEDFSGQIAPHLPNNSTLSCGYDKFLLEYLLTEWKRHFLRKRPERRTRVLFRSLEVAAQASRMPATGARVATIHDLGVSVALWVSAFEVLTHPKTGNSNKYTVVDCIGNADWLDRALKATRYTLKSGAGNVMRKINFCQRLYMELYQARNDFFHGNRVTQKNLFPFKKSCLPILPACATLVYRAALAGFAQPAPNKRSKHRTLQEALSDRFSYLSKVQEYESAMSRIMLLSRK